MEREKEQEGYFYGTKLEAERALGVFPLRNMKPGKGPWGETASENPIMNAFTDGAWGDKDLINALRDDREKTDQ